MALCGECETRVAIGVQCAACDCWYHCSGSQPCVPPGELTDPPFVCRRCSSLIASPATEDGLPKQRRLVVDMGELRRRVHQSSDHGSDAGADSVRSGGRSSLAASSLFVGRGALGPRPVHLSGVEDTTITESAAPHMEALQNAVSETAKADESARGAEWWRRERLAECGPEMLRDHRESYFRNAPCWGRPQTQLPPLSSPSGRSLAGVFGNPSADSGIGGVHAGFAAPQSIRLSVIEETQSGQ